MGRVERLADLPAFASRTADPLQRPDAQTPDLFDQPVDPADFDRVEADLDPADLDRVEADFDRVEADLDRVEADLDPGDFYSTNLAPLDGGPVEPFEFAGVVGVQTPVTFDPASIEATNLSWSLSPGEALSGHRVIGVGQDATSLAHLQESDGVVRATPIQWSQDIEPELTDNVGQFLFNRPLSPELRQEVIDAAHTDLDAVAAGYADLDRRIDAFMADARQNSAYYHQGLLLRHGIQHFDEGRAQRAADRAFSDERLALDLTAQNAAALIAVAGGEPALGTAQTRFARALEQHGQSRSGLTEDDQQRIVEASALGDEGRARALAFAQAASAWADGGLTDTWNRPGALELTGREVTSTQLVAANSQGGRPHPEFAANLDDILARLELAGHHHESALMRQYAAVHLGDMIFNAGQGHYRALYRQIQHTEPTSVASAALQGQLTQTEAGRAALRQFEVLMNPAEFIGITQVGHASNYAPPMSRLSSGDYPQIVQEQLGGAIDRAIDKVGTDAVIAVGTMVIAPEAVLLRAGAGIRSLGLSTRLARAGGSIYRAGRRGVDDAIYQFRRHFDLPHGYRPIGGSIGAAVRGEHLLPQGVLRLAQNRRGERVILRSNGSLAVGPKGTDFIIRNEIPIPREVATNGSDLMGAVASRLDQPLPITRDLLDSGLFFGARNAGTHANLFREWISRPGRSAHLMPDGTVRYTATMRGRGAISVHVRDGYADFSPYFHQGVPGGGVTIQVRAGRQANDNQRRLDQREATRMLREDIQAGRIDSSRFTAAELADIRSGASTIGRYTWHHGTTSGRMELVPRDIHDRFNHQGWF